MCLDDSCIGIATLVGLICTAIGLFTAGLCNAGGRADDEIERQMQRPPPPPVRWPRHPEDTQ